jgi:HTH-type transcriptional regulator/antitoxin HigA
MATRNENPAPFMAVHPGMMIKPELEERGISQKEFAKMLGTQPSHLSEVLNGKRALTTELAVKIENAIGLPAKILLSAQTQYELESTNNSTLSDDNQHETIAVTIPVRDRNLLRELVRKFGWACML